MVESAEGNVPVRVGDVLAGKYRVERVLGAGAMGVVVAARHMELHELQALKFMLPSALGDGEGVERFLREARAAARLKSQHVARVHDVGRLETGAPYIVMEYLEGSDLKALMEQRGPLPVVDTVRYLLQACEALAEAHAAGIIHRDLKPANLFLTAGPGGGACVKLLDFGIAKMPAGAPGAGEMTGTTALLGTPLYMSPEQMRSTRDVDARTDIWALGVILYRALTGKPPFAGSTLTEICTSVISDQPEPPSRLRPDLPAGLEAVILRCLAKNPAQRFGSIHELGAALMPFAGVGGAPVQPAESAPAPPPQAPPQYAYPTNHGPYGPVPNQAGWSGAQAGAWQGGASAPPNYAPPYGQGTAAQAMTASGQAMAPAQARSSAAPIVIGGLLAVIGIGAAIGAAVFMSKRGDEPKEGAKSESSAVAPQPVEAHSSTPVTEGQPIASAAGGTAQSPPPRAGTAGAPIKAPASQPAPAPTGTNLPVGAACATASQCTSGFCVDRVCCDIACTGKCMACTARKKFSGGGDGTCGFISGGEDPDRECGGGSKRCDGMGGCVSLTPEQIKNLTGH
jgi:serine/threonine-protein kinase